MKRLLATCLLLWIAAFLGSMPAMADTQSDLNAFKELQQSKWDAQKELQQKDIDSLRQQVAAVDKRVDDQLAQVGQAVDRYGVAATWTGLVVTALLVLGGFLGYRNAKSEAKDAAIESATEAATQQAEASAQSWLNAHAAALQERFSVLEQKAAQVLGSMDTIHSDVQNHATSTKAEISEALSDVQGSVGKTDAPPTPQQEKSQQILAVRVQELEKAESSYSFEDWDTRAHAAYWDKKFEDAAYFWRKAANIPNAGAANVAMVLVNRGVAQVRLKQHEAAIASWEELLRRFGDASELALREQVAKALRNKGSALRQLGRSEDAIACYDETLRRFGDASETELREQVANALNGLGFHHLLQAKLKRPQTPEGQAALHIALQHLNHAIERSPQANGIRLGNRAYVHYFLGQTEQAQADFFAALRAPVDGGDALYQGALKDLEIHPIPEDQGMRELVERAWATYQQEVGDGASKDSSQ